MSTTEAEWQDRANRLISAANAKDREIAELRRQLAIMTAERDAERAMAQHYYPGKRH